MLKLEIVTPEKRVFDGSVDSVTVPTASGSAGILPNHAPLISSLAPGLLSYTSKGATENVAISGGFVEVSANKVAVLADSAQTAEDVDIGEARAEREAAERELSAAGLTSVEKAETLRERLETAAAKLAVAGTK